MSCKVYKCTENNFGSQFKAHSNLEDQKARRYLKWESKSLAFQITHAVTTGIM
jgi:hypothetical protein